MARHTTHHRAEDVQTLDLRGGEANPTTLRGFEGGQFGAEGGEAREVCHTNVVASGVPAPEWGLYPGRTLQTGQCGDENVKVATKLSDTT